MQPNSEPSPADIAAVNSFLGTPDATPVAPVQTPTPVDTPSLQNPVQAPQMQPEPVQSQPTPSSQPQDPFSTVFAQQPTEPVAPVAPAQPTQPEPVAPVQPTQPEPVQPVQAPAQPVQPANEYQTYDEYMAQVLANVPAIPTAPDPSTIDESDPEAVKQFFDDLVTTAVAKSEATTARKSAIKDSENALWNQAFNKYASLRDNKPLRDTVHNIRIANFQRGVAMTPTQAADSLLDLMKGQYQKGVTDSSVVTTIESVQPNGGGTGAPLPTTLDRDTVLTSVQDGGEAALAAYLDGEVKAGRL